MSSNKHGRVPAVSVGMPVYNGEATLQAAIECVLNQTFTDFELIISDNASTDETEDICRRYASLDSRIRYVRQSVNFGAVKNFNFVLDQAVAEYFMWATSDDVKSVDFLEINYSFLKSNLDYVASTCPTRFEGKAFDSRRMGDASLEGDLSERYVQYFNAWHANGRFCSLMRTSALKSATYLESDFFGSDWAAMLSIITFGKTHRSDRGYVVLGKSGFSNSGSIYKHYRKRVVHFFIPFYELILAVFRMSSAIPFSCKAAIFFSLLKMNLQAVNGYVRIEIKRLMTRGASSNGA